MAELNKRQHEVLAGTLAYVRGNLADARTTLENQADIITEARDELRSLYHEVAAVCERVEKLKEAHHAASAALENPGA